MLQNLLNRNGSGAFPIYTSKGLGCFFENSTELQSEVILHDNYEVRQAVSILVEVLTADWGVGYDSELAAGLDFGLLVLQLH